MIFFIQIHVMIGVKNMTKNVTQSNWVAQSSFHWMKHYPKNLTGQIFLNANTHIYEIMVTDKQGRQVGLGRIARSLADAKKAGDNLVKENS